MSEIPKFREKYRYRSQDCESCSIQEVVEAEISAVGRMTESGMLEEIRARQDKIADILAFLATELSVVKQVDLAEKLHWELDDGQKPQPAGGIPTVRKKPPSGERGSW